MWKLRQSILECVRTLGNHSGCHQLPERSFFYKGKQFPVCARCTGVFLGQTTALLLIPLKISIGLGTAVSCLSVMGLDWFLQEIRLKPSTNKRRLVTGFLGGLGVFGIYIHMGRFVIRWMRRQSMP